MAHRNVFVLQSSQAASAHLLSGVLRGLHSRHPAIFALNCPCPPEHGLGDDAATNAARLALEARAYPLLVYDPAAGDALADRMSLDGNPMPDETWPTYDLRYLDAEGQEQVMALPVTIADWAATEGRFKKHFTPVRPDVDAETLLPFDQYLAAAPEDREGKRPFINVLENDRRLGRLGVSDEIVELARDRLALWTQLRQMAGLELAPSVRAGLEAEFESRSETRMNALKAEHERTVFDLKASYPGLVARRLAEGLIRATAQGQGTLADLLQHLDTLPAPPAGVPAPERRPAETPSTGRTNGAAVKAPEAAAPAPVAPAAATAVEEPEEGLVMEAYIQSELCTACNECTNLNKKMFAYNAKKQAYIKDPKAGSFRELVMAAEKCPVSIIHPGTPVKPGEKDLAKWVKRAEKFA